MDNIEVFVCSEGLPFTCEPGFWRLFSFPIGEWFDSYVIVEKPLIDEDLITVKLEAPLRVVP